MNLLGLANIITLCNTVEPWQDVSVKYYCWDLEQRLIKNKVKIAGVNVYY